MLFSASAISPDIQLVGVVLSIIYPLSHPPLLTASPPPPTPVFSPSSTPHPHLSRSCFLLRSTQHAVSLFLSVRDTRAHLAPSLSSACNHRASLFFPPFAVLPSLSVSLTLFRRSCLTSALSHLSVPLLLPVPTSSACPPLCRNTPTCHVVVWVHVPRTRTHSGARPTATASDAEYLRS